MAVSLFSIMDGLLKWLGQQGYHTMQMIFFRSFFAFLPLSFILFRPSFRIAIHMTNKWGHFWRCFVGLASMVGFFYGYQMMPLADAVAIGFAAPIFVTALSVPLLGERVGVRRWSACLVGFVGVLIMVKPGEGLLQSGALFALVGTLGFAIAVIQIRKLSLTDSNSSIIFYFTLFSTLVSTAFLPFVWVTPSFEHLLLLISLGLLGGTAQIAMTQAFRIAELPVVMPFEYVAILWSTAIGYFVFEQIPGVHIWGGLVLVIGSGLYIVYREAYLGRKRTLPLPESEG